MLLGEGLVGLAEVDLFASRQFVHTQVSLLLKLGDTQLQLRQAFWRELVQVADVGCTDSEIRFCHPRGDQKALREQDPPANLPPPRLLLVRQLLLPSTCVRQQKTIPGGAPHRQSGRSSPAHANCPCETVAMHIRY